MCFLYTLQRQYTENLKQIFPKIKLSGFSPHSYIHLYIPTVGLPILLQENMCTEWSEYINPSQKHECGNWDCGRAVSFLRVHTSDFLCSVLSCSQKSCCILPTYTGLTWRCQPDAWRLVSRALFTTLTQTWPLSRRVIHQSVRRYPDPGLDLYMFINM